MEAQEIERVFGVQLELACPRQRENLSRATEREVEPCQVRSRADRPCPYPAVVKIRGVPFCGRCAREQKAYFAIGELTQPQSLSNEPLVGMPEGAQRKLVRQAIRAAKRDGSSFESLAVG